MLGLALVAFALPPTLSRAVEWEIQPNASTQLTVSNNIQLQPDGSQEAGATTRASVGAQVRANGRRLHIIPTASFTDCFSILACGD